jgi:hypothetical protein
MLSSESLQSLMMISGLGILCWLMLRGKYASRRRAALSVHLPALKHNANARSHPSGFTGTGSLSAPADVLKWQVELHDLGRQLKAELDSKMIAVRTMSQACDQSARRLRELIRIAGELEVPRECLLSEARRLAAQGWPNQKIAHVLAVGENDVRDMLNDDQPR